MELITGLVYLRESIRNFMSKIRNPAEIAPLKRPVNRCCVAGGLTLQLDCLVMLITQSEISKRGGNLDDTERCSR